MIIVYAVFFLFLQLCHIMSAFLFNNEFSIIVKKSDKRFNWEEEISINVGKICHFHFHSLLFLFLVFLLSQSCKLFSVLLSDVKFSREFNVEMKEWLRNLIILLCYALFIDVVNEKTKGCKRDQ